MGFQPDQPKKKEEMNNAYFFSAGSSKGFNTETSGAWSKKASYAFLYLYRMRFTALVLHSNLVANCLMLWYSLEETLTMSQEVILDLVFMLQI